MLTYAGVCWRGLSAAGVPALAAARSHLALLHFSGTNKYLLTSTKVQILTPEEVLTASAKPLVLRPIAPALALAAAMSLHARLGAGTLIQSLNRALIEP